MVRNVISFIVGLVVGFIVVAGIEMINYGLFPLPEGLDVTDKEGMIEHIRQLPPLAYIIVMVAHFLGALLAALTVTMIAEHSKLKISLGLGLFFMLMGIINLITIPHPVWFSVVDTLTYLPGAFLGYRLAQRFA